MSVSWVGEYFFWYRPTRVVPDKRPLNGCVCVCVCNAGSARQYDNMKQSIPQFDQILQLFVIIKLVKCTFNLIKLTKTIPVQDYWNLLYCNLSKDYFNQIKWLVVVD